ncbi:MAG: hypothetical protein LIP08_06025 [Bacteroides sp.]|nr:hypothetical protein [Bacteroides sp.]
MKKICMFIMICLAAAHVSLSAQTGPKGPITFQEFYNTLSPHGTWIEYPQYGNVWHPNVSDFRPYATNGHWENTTDGWYWDSEYDWGWAPFHYGSWTYDNSYGWLWIPGYEWAPSWVVWGETDDYYAWAPVGPGADISADSWRGWKPDHDYYWNVVERNHITDHNIAHRLSSENIVRNNAGRITLLNNFRHSAGNRYYSAGPDAHQVAGHTRKEVIPSVLIDGDRQNSHRATQTSLRNDTKEIPVYRPQVYHPEPMQVRRADENSISPIHKESSWPGNNDFNRHKSNIENLPVRQSSMHQIAPSGNFHRENSGGGERPERPERQGGGEIHGGGERQSGGGHR